jgi:protein Tex
MNDKHIVKISKELNLKENQVFATAKLLNEDATVPFIARYRKELTGSLDEVEIMAIRDRLAQLDELDKRREAILKSLEERELLTEELKEKIDDAETLTELEDIYLPFRPKKRTRATIAKEKGLEPLATTIFEQESTDVNADAEKYIDEEKGVKSIEEALAGARDIIAEWVNENKLAREKTRELFERKSFVFSKVAKDKEEEGIKYKDYFDWKEQASSAPSHRLLAMYRGENEGFLRLNINPDEEEAIEILDKMFVKNFSSTESVTKNSASEQVLMSVKDCYKRMLSLSIETEFRNLLKEKADKQAILVFADNLRQLLLAPPLGEKNILALDPGFRTGCKVVCLDRQGKLLHNDTIYPHTGAAVKLKAVETIIELVKKYQTEIVAVGNGTAGRETEEFVRTVLERASEAVPKEPASADLQDVGNEVSLKNIPVVMVNESGASIYSASEVAREEFPDYDVTVRGSVSIGRRLIDPLAELVKIDPKSIGVGQYQHDVNQTMLKQKLDDVVMSCVNGVGVEVNTASKQLLTYVSGLGPKLAQSIVEFRNENGAFKSREDLKKVARLKNKAFEQAAGFLRIRNGENPLDASAVHPETYHIVEKMATDIGCTVKELISFPQNQAKIDVNKYISDTVGLPTLEDIRAELAKPGRDPREKFEIFEFAKDVGKLEDLKPGMKLPGIVTNITNFGAFVDIGVHQDGLVHISQIADGYIKNPADILKVAQRVTVTVVEVDLARKRIQLSMRSGKEKPAEKKPHKFTKEDADKKLKTLMEKFNKQ